MHMFESVFRFLFAWLDKIVGWLIMQDITCLKLFQTSIFCEKFMEQIQR